MSFDREQIRLAAEERNAKAIKDRIPDLKVLHSQAPVMQSLITGSVSWDRYLSYLQAMSNRVGSVKRAAQAKQNDPAVWDPQELSKCKSEVLRTGAMLEVLSVVMQLPKALIEEGERAGELVAQFEKNNEPADKPQP